MSEEFSTLSEEVQEIKKILKNGLNSLNETLKEVLKKWAWVKKNTIRKGLIMKL